ncbi:MAG: J domain-containing protein [Acidimicrobiaceae bacterium]|nr:J domain-containing protein [Acidimicrobiaceae bacterium]
MATEHTYYDILGVSITASDAEIRDAYRQRAREVHPDSAARTSANASVRMAEISQAWSVLSNNARRRQYDESLLNPRDVDNSASHVSATSPVFQMADMQFVERARFPWRFVLIIIVVGTAIILGINAAGQQRKPVGPDGLLQSGSCIVVDANLAAVEVACEEPHDGVVRQLIGFDKVCPRDTEAIRDRQGMGIACVVRN